MAIKVKELIEKLEEKDQEAVVEFVVIETTGMLVCVDIGSQADGLLTILENFLRVE